MIPTLFSKYLFNKYRRFNKYWRVGRPVVVATIAVVAATAARLALDPWLGDRQAFLTYLAAVIALVFVGEVLPALLVSLAGIPFAAWFFLEPRRTFVIADLSETVAFPAYLAMALPIVVLGALYWRSRRSASESEKRCDLQFLTLTSERERLENELDRLTRDLRSLDERRGDLLSLLASELRRPLVPIASAASFHRVAATASEMESAMSIVRQEAAELGRLIEDLLDAFRRGRGRYSISKSRIDLTAVVSAAVESLRAIATQAGRSLTVSVSRDPVWIDGHAEQLARLAHRLLKNSIRCTSPGEEIWVMVHNREGEAVFKVKDTGIGLSPEDLRYVFQVERLLSSDRRWIALGLAASKSILELHGGTITVHSDGEGQGCEYVIRLPLRNAPPSSAAAVEMPGLDAT